MKKTYKIVNDPADNEVVIAALPVCEEELNDLVGSTLTEVATDDPFTIFSFEDAHGTRCDLLVSDYGAVYMTEPY